MRKKLSAIGNSLGVVIERPILELLSITRDTELELTTDGERLIISPVRRSKRGPVKASLERAMDTPAESLRKVRTRLEGPPLTDEEIARLRSKGRP